MSRISMLCAAATVAVAALSVASPASANPYHLVRWADTGFCQVWDDGAPNWPWPAPHHRISRHVPTFVEALAVKEHLLRTGHCKF